VHVDLIKPTLKAPVIKPLKQKSDDLRVNFAFKFNLRHHMEGQVSDEDLMKVAEESVLVYKGLDASALVSNDTKDYIVDLQAGAYTCSLLGST